ncbi:MULTISPECIES: conjugal transfer protein TraB [unclassified Mesorhizobium]|uniref:conjugal transfer protein TraB n=1 Tax=unclassified Mesorhizobium TaxID=325217 RepID=UPI00112AA838|nr:MULTISPECIES: conjugal transfer protein TraB [unclassified Mesorhizobium]MBZ9898295.1 conjugal transfer protein TraB [Mesorhizobium sp. BR1-1-6]TPN30290.1 conjugal transfer protein TraB [Mesorhizobium sp. B1-1-6]
MILIAGGVAAGAIGWSGNPLALPMAMAFPALWALSPSRLVAACASAGYFLAASRGLPQGVANFYGSQFAVGIALWFTASLAFVAVHAVLWTSSQGWRVLRYAIAAVAISIPPFGVVGWAHPITAAGILFPAWGWFGLAAAAILMLTMATKRWPIAAALLGGFWTWSAAHWTPPNPPEGWVSVDTRFRGSAGHYAGYAQQGETIIVAKTAAMDGARIIVLPESAAGLWTPTVERLWTRALTGSGVTVIAGAAVVDQGGYDNVMMRISAEGSEILYRERMPVPISMWQPWLAWVGQRSGARAHVFANPVVDVEGVKVAPLICYEQLIVWPVLQSMLYRPDAIVASGNGWWTASTSILAIQEANAQAWASLFGLALVSAVNR